MQAGRDVFLGTNGVRWKAADTVRASADIVQMDS